MTTRFRSLTILAALALVGSIAAGCGSPTFGERLQVQGETLAQAGRDHDRGAELVREGEAELGKARRNEASAMSKIEEGRQLMRNAESVAAAR